jgi:THO complex subunit 4
VPYSRPRRGAPDAACGDSYVAGPPGEPARGAAREAGAGDEPRRRGGLRCRWPQELFGFAGNLTRCDINYDKSGRSKGTAEIAFARKCAPFAQLRCYAPTRAPAASGPPNSPAARLPQAGRG